MKRISRGEREHRNRRQRQHSPNNAQVRADGNMMVPGVAGMPGAVPPPPSGFASANAPQAPGLLPWDVLFTKEQINEFKDAFEEYDLDGDDILSIHELSRLMAAYGCNPSLDELKEMVLRVNGLKKTSASQQVSADTIDFIGFLILLSNNMQADNGVGAMQT